MRQAQDSAVFRVSAPRLLKTWQGDCRVAYVESACAWLADYVEASAPYTSAHQMGTARMGADPSTSVCDPNGESWDVSGLFVCDGAALPTSIGESHGLQTSWP